MIEIRPDIRFPDYPRTPFRSRTPVALPTSISARSEPQLWFTSTRGGLSSHPDWVVDEKRVKGVCEDAAADPGVSCDRLNCNPLELQSKGTRFGNWLLLGRTVAKTGDRFNEIFAR